MATQNPGFHPLIQHETLTARSLQNDAERQAASDIFRKAEEYEYLGRFDEAYKILNQKYNFGKFKALVPSYEYLYGRIKMHHGFYREAKEHYAKAKKLLENADEDLSIQSQLLLELLEAIIMFFDWASTEARLNSGPKIVELYENWAKYKAPADLDYYTLCVENLYFILLKNHPDLGPGIAEQASRWTEILEVHLKGDNAAVAFPLFMVILNNQKTLPQVLELKSTIMKTIESEKLLTNMAKTIEGYCELRQGQIAFAEETDSKTANKHFKEGRRFFKSAGNLEAPCEIDSFETISYAQKRLLEGADNPDEVRKRVLKMIENLGKLYGKFTELNFPNRMQNTIKVIFGMNENLIGSHEISAITARLWVQLGKATGVQINTPTQFVAGAADVMKTDNIEEVLEVCARFKEETEAQWDDALRTAWLRTVAKAHTRLRMYDEAIQELALAIELLNRQWMHAEAADATTEYLSLKYEKVSTLPDEEAAYLFEELLEELDEAIDDDEGSTARLAPWLTKLLWKASLLVGEKRLVDLGQTAPQADAILEEVEPIIKQLVEQEPDFKPFQKQVIISKVLVLRAQKKYEQALAMVENYLPSKWNVIKQVKKTDEDEIEEVSMHLLACTIFLPELSDRADQLDRKTIEKWTKICFTHLKEALKLAEKHQLASSFCDALYDEAICYMALGEHAKALPKLEHASGIADQIRELSPKGTRFDSFLSNAIGSATLTGGIADAAMKACLKIPNVVACWSWIQKAKARAFSDMMQHEGELTDHFMRVMDDVESFGMPWDDVNLDLRHMALIYRLQSLMEKPTGFPLNNWDEEEMEKALIFRRKQIREVMDQMSEIPQLRGALSVWRGTPATHEDMGWLGNYKMGEQNIVFVDWAHSFDDIIISVYKPGGTRVLPGLGLVTTKVDSEIRIQTCTLKLTQVKSWVQEYLKDQDIPLESENSFDDLDIIKDLVACLTELTQPGDLLVLSPTDVLHGVPLHALKIGEKENGERAALIERNPVVYVPSFSIMRQCVTRLRLARNHNLLEPGLRQSTLIGVKEEYDIPDPEVPESLERMAGSLRGQIFTGDECTLSKFAEEASNTTDILHFHGHMDYEDPRPLQRYLVLGNGDTITGRQLADIKFPQKTAPLVSVIACLSGGQQILTGDEPIGVVPALMAAGAASVIATLWPTDSASGLKFAESLYKTRQECDENSTIWNIAEGVRKATLEIMKNEDTKTPYYWAPFCLHGAWLRGTGKAGALPQADGVDGLTQRFDKMIQLQF